MSTRLNDIANALDATADELRGELRDSETSSVVHLLNYVASVVRHEDGRPQGRRWFAESPLDDGPNDELDRPLSRKELQSLRGLDGPPPIDKVEMSRAVQALAIRAVRELLRRREEVQHAPLFGAPPMTVGFALLGCACGFRPSGNPSPEEQLVVHLAMAQVASGR